VASVARNLATALKTFGRDRSPEDKQKVLQLETELCKVVRDEVAEQIDAAAEAQHELQL